ncbi:MAG: helix-turn-helix domain-containing protein [Pseudomonadota bacterium]
MGERAKPEVIITRLREIEVRMGRGKTAAAAARAVGVTEQTVYRWRKG